MTDSDQMKIKGPGIGLRMSLYVVSLLAVLFLLISFIFILNQKNILIQNMERSGYALSRAVAKNCENALIGNDFWTLGTMTAEITRNRNILFMAIIKPDGKIVAHSDTRMVESFLTDTELTGWVKGKRIPRREIVYQDKSCMVITLPISSKNSLWGFIQTGHSLAPLQESIRTAYKNALTIAVLFIAMGTVFVLLLSRRITVPIIQLMRGAREIGAGNLDYRITVNRTDELGLLATTFNQMSFDLKKSREKLEESKKLERELELAYQIQQSLLPITCPTANGIEVAAFCKPAQIVGGDFYDFLFLSDHLLGIVIGDVSGKSIQSALYMAITQSLIRSHADRGLSPREVLIATNRQLATTLRKNAFVTLFYMVIDREKAEVTYASAGHNPMVLVKPATGKTTLLKGRGYPLGLDESLFNERIEEQTLKLDEEDLLILFTDGIIEAMDDQGQEFTLERFIELLKTGTLQNHPQLEGFNLAIFQEILLFSHGVSQHDDITLVSLRVRHGVPQIVTQPSAAHLSP
jgi:serine phosphatase RsbU (regulator of sigma subunit)/uncharacterized membrane protein affecting hemolysin expression